MSLKNERNIDLITHHERGRKNEFTRGFYDLKV